MRTEQLKRAEEGVAGTMSRDGAKVVFGPFETAFTDGTTIHVPEPPPMADLTATEVAVTRGFIDHETGHHTITDMNVWDAWCKKIEANPSRHTDLQVSIGNCLEDVRIEAEKARIYPGARRNLSDLIRAMFRKSQEGLDAARSEGWDPSTDQGFAGIAGYAVSWQGRHEIYGPAVGGDALVKRYVPARWMERVAEWTNEVLSIPRDKGHTAAVLALAERVYDALVDAVEAPPLPTDPPMGGSGGESDDDEEGGPEGDAEEEEGCEGSDDDGTAEGGSGEEEEGDGEGEGSEDAEGEEAGEEGTEGEGDGGDAEGEGAEDGEGEGEGEGEGTEGDGEGEGEGDGEGSGEGEGEGEGDGSGEGEGEGEGEGSGAGEDGDFVEVHVPSEDPGEEAEEEDDGPEGGESNVAGQGGPKNQVDSSVLPKEPTIKVSPESVVADAMAGARGKADPKGVRVFTTSGDLYCDPDGTRTGKPDGLANRSYVEFCHDDHTRAWRYILRNRDRYSGEYDRTVANNRSKVAAVMRWLSQMIESYDTLRQTGGWNDGDRLDTSRLAGVLAGSENIWRRRERTDAVNTAVMVLVDQSGSMKGEKLEVATECAILLAEALDRSHGVAYEIAGFNTIRGAWRGAYDAKGDVDEAVKAKQARIPSGWYWGCGLNINQHKRFDDRLSATRHVIAGMVRVQTHANNDLRAVQWAADRLMERPEPRKLLIVLSDGRPCDEVSFHGTDEDSQAEWRKRRQAIARGEGDPRPLPDTGFAATIKKVEDLGIGVCSVGIQSDAPEAYYDVHAVVGSLPDLSTTAMRTLARLLRAKGGGRR